MEFIPVKRYYYLREVAFEYDVNDRTLMHYVRDFNVPCSMKGSYDAIALKENGLERLRLCYDLYRETKMRRKSIGKLSNELIEAILNELKQKKRSSNPGLGLMQ